ncbi:MAG: ethanolamine ammonia-lyase subunit EutB, partial [Niveispirillum sp.]|nr:ethanolamine ammonia-lyase subunit EutB [Niveispirillum sp.]
MAYSATVGRTTYRFDDLKALLARATPARSGDQLAGVAARSDAERVAARIALADLPLKTLLTEPLIPYEGDEVTRLILDSHVTAAFAPIAGFTVGQLRDWLLSDAATSDALTALAPGLTPEMVAATSKLMRNQDLIAVGRKARVVTAFRTTIGLPGRLSVRLQPNHPTDDPKAIAASILDGMMYGCGDGSIGINPATDSVGRCLDILSM